MMGVFNAADRIITEIWSSSGVFRSHLSLTMSMTLVKREDSSVRISLTSKLAPSLRCSIVARYTHDVAPKFHHEPFSDLLNVKRTLWSPWVFLVLPSILSRYFIPCFTSLLDFSCSDKTLVMFGCFFLFSFLIFFKTLVAFCSS